MRGALESLEVVRFGPHSGGDRFRTGLRTLLRASVSALVGQRFRPRAHGLSATETERGADQAAALLGPVERAALLAYVRVAR